jgi:hypothetical protein
LTPRFAAGTIGPFNLPGVSRSTAGVRREQAMSGPDLSEALRLRTMRLVVVALCVGVVSLAGVMIWLRDAAPLPPPPGVPLLTFVGLGLAAVLAVGSVALPLVLQASWRRGLRQQPGAAPIDRRTGRALGPEEVWWVRYQTRLIVQAALLEGATFFQLIAYRIEGLPVSLGVAAGLSLCLLMLFPTRAGVERWVAAQRDLVEQGR